MSGKKIFAPFPVFALLFVFAFAPCPGRAVEEPCPTPKGQKIDFTVPENGRVVKSLYYEPPLNPGQKAPVVVFSPGLGGTCQGYAYLAEGWAMAGYYVFVLQHQGSDDAVWRPVEHGKRLESMRGAVTVKNLLNRLEDINTVLNELEKLDADKSGVFYQRLDLDRIGLGGHSFGALTTQIIGGQLLPMAGDKYKDSRVKAALVLSPSYPQKELMMENPFGKVAIPWMLMTGTEDVSIVIDRKAEERLKVFDALPPGHKYQLVINGGNHMLFTGRNRPAKSGEVARLSTLFWDAALKRDPKAQEKLDGPAARELFSPQDDWKIK